LRRFTSLLKDLLVVQLRFSDVDHKTTSKGSQFIGIRFRTSADDENIAHNVDEYCPRTPLLITGHYAGGRVGRHEGSLEDGEESDEVFSGVDYESEGSETSTRARYGEKNRRNGAEDEEAFLRVRLGRNEDTSHPSLSALARGNPSSETSRDPSPPHSAVPPPDFPLNGHASAHACPQCGCTALMDCVTYRKCPVCSWKDGPTAQEILEQQ
jgi:hypothetical protein